MSIHLTEQLDVDIYLDLFDSELREAVSVENDAKIVSLGIKWIHKKAILKTVTIEEATIGIGNSSVTIKYDGCIKEIAYKIWIELTTRKIGLRKVLQYKAFADFDAIKIAF